ncbi:hypothetical protein ABFP60_03465 [Clostridioides difficile]
MGKRLKYELKQKDQAIIEVKRKNKNESNKRLLRNIVTVSKCTSKNITSNYYGSGVGGYGLNLI